MNDKTMKRPTMSDIASQVGVSHATVSLVLNEAPGKRVSEKVRERVLAVAAELGYQKTAPANDPIGGIIVLLIDDLMASQHAAPLIEGVRSAAEEQGLAALTVVTGGQVEFAESILDYLGRRQIVGVIYATLITQLAPVLPSNLGNYPAVLLNCHQQRAEFSSIIPGDHAGGYAATEALIKAGHRRIAMIDAGRQRLEAARDRLSGYRQALTTYDIAVDPELILSEAWSLDLGREKMLQLLDLPLPPTAVFCFSDRVAMGAYDAIRMRGLRIPDDISVVGFDDESLARKILPPLTTLKLPHEDMGRWAVSELLEKVMQPKKPPVRLKMECQLILRASVGPPP
ncbi:MULTISPECIES: LacI family DNA-binding transcriptional regulator [unclassified Rhizobium]|uniref:LacI family DNA-binding transcriptional regulator n=1 Tax=unclassified Rhizobium TaxID=2613769 RepID=UPI001FEEB895|nr:MULTISPECIES: LacI family DNA-binding transcriptional regulator [unclassified Rhizobium]